MQYKKVVKQKEQKSAVPKQFLNTKFIPFDETHFDAVRGFILLRGFNPLHQQEELVGAMLLRSIKRIFFMLMPKTWFKVEEFILR